MVKRIIILLNLAIIMLILIECTSSEKKSSVPELTSKVKTKKHEFQFPKYIPHYSYFGVEQLDIAYNTHNKENREKYDSPPQLTSLIKKKANEVLLDYYFNECKGDSLESEFGLKDIYLGTYIHGNRLNRIVMLLLRNIPSGNLDGKVIFESTGSDYMCKDVFDFRLCDMYDFKDSILIRKSIMDQLNIQWACIRKYPGNYNSNFQFKSLYHNENGYSIEKYVLGFTKNGIDTILYSNILISNKLKSNK